MNDDSTLTYVPIGVPIAASEHNSNPSSLEEADNNNSTTIDSTLTKETKAVKIGAPQSSASTEETNNEINGDDSNLPSFSLVAVPVNKYNVNDDVSVNINIESADEAINQYQNLTNKVEDCTAYLDTNYFTDNLRTYYNSLSDDTQKQLSLLSTRISCLFEMLSSSINSYLNKDEEKYRKLLELINNLNEFNSDINPLSEYATKDQMETINVIKEGIIDKLGIDSDGEDAKQLRIDIDKFLLGYKKENYGENISKMINENISKLKCFLNHIPDNYIEQEKKYKWDSNVDDSKKEEGYTAECEWIEFNGVKFRVTRLTDDNSPYKTLMNYINKSYCYDLINEMSSWEPNIIDLLKKREYIDVVVPDLQSLVGAAHYQSGSFYADFIYLPTKMMGGFVYDDNSMYTYLKECLVHEMSHYIDGICGVTQSLEEFQNPTEACDFMAELMNKYQYDMELINHHGVLSDEDTELFKNFKIEQGEWSCEGMAEFLRADLVDHDAFVSIIGEEAYNKLFDGLKNSNRVYNYDTELIIGDNNEITTILEKDGRKTTYKGGIRVEETTTDENGVSKTDKFEYYPNGNLMRSTMTSSDGSKNEYHYYPDGKEKSKWFSSTDGSRSEWQFYPDGTEKSTCVINAEGARYENVFYPNGNIKFSSVKSNDYESYSEYDQYGNLISKKENGI